MADGSGRKQDEDLYAWISTIPFSKPTKNLNRDFSDAVMMAEVLKVYYPRNVDLHNYVAASSLSTKKENWNLLNRKILSKIDMKLTKETISQLANCQPGVIENVLQDLRNRVLKNSVFQNSQNISDDDKDKDPMEEGAKATTSEQLSLASDNSNIVPMTSIFARVREKFLIVYHWLLSWLLIWNYFPRITLQSLRGATGGSRREDAEVSKMEGVAATSEEGDAISRQVCAQLKQELLEKNDVISTLNHKLAYLESAMKLQDLRISNLTTQLLQNAVEAEQLGKTQTNSDQQAKARLRSQSTREKAKIEV